MKIFNIMSCALIFLASAAVAQETSSNREDTGAPKPPAPATLQSTKTGYFGPVLGVSTANRDVGTGLGYGGDIAFFPHPNIGLGGKYRGADHGTPATNLFAAEFLLRPSDPLVIGLLVGVMNYDDEVGGVEDSRTEFAYGSRVSYDFRLDDTVFSFGPELNWVLFKPVDRTVSVVNILATFKIWL